jgi:hypothetical protein
MDLLHVSSAQQAFNSAGIVEHNIFTTQCLITKA